MRLLLDSDALIWHVLDDARLGPVPTAAIEAPDAEALVSVASLWEIAIKSAIGKLRVPGDLPARIEGLGFELLPITTAHAWQLRSLPHHHRDPFDRLLIAQAQLERLAIVSADDVFADYGVEVVWG